MTEMPTVTVSEIPDDAVVIDCREHDEWAAGHAPGAVHIPMGQVGERIDELPDGRIMVICRSGNRSRQVCEFLKSQGREAVNVSDGTMGWADRGWPLES